MKEIWNDAWNELECVNKRMNEYLEKSTVNSLKQLTTAINRLNEKCEKFDTYMQPSEPKEIELPFTSKEFADTWNTWKDYLQEQHGQVIRSRSQQSALTILKQYAEDNEETAIFMLHHAMMTRARNFYKVTKETATKIETDIRF